MEIKKVYDDYKPLIEKEISFIELSDGTCFKKLQVIYDKSIKDYDSITKIHFGSALKVIGILKLSPTKDQVIELHAKSITILADCSEDYPIQPKPHSREFLREEAYLRPRTTLFQAVFRIRSIKLWLFTNIFKTMAIFISKPQYLPQVTVKVQEKCSK